MSICELPRCGWGFGETTRFLCRAEDSSMPRKTLEINNIRRRAERAAAAMIGSFNHGEHRDHRGRIKESVWVAHDMQGEAAVIECLRLSLRALCALCG